MRWQDYLLLVLLGAAYLVYRLMEKRRSRARQRRRNRPANQLTRREQAALRKLQASGFRLAEIHPTVPVTITADQKSKTVDWSGNFTVTRKGKVYLVKVLKGDTSLASSGLRRELLLDYLLLQPHGLFIFDGERESLQELDIHFNGGGNGGNAKLAIRVILILLIIAGLALFYRLVLGGGG